AALAAAPLRAIGGERHALDVALERDGDDAVLALDEVLVLDLTLDVDDLGLTRGGELRLDVVELFFDDIHDAQARGEDRQVFLDLLAELLELIANLVAAERREAG